MGETTTFEDQMNRRVRYETEKGVLLFDQRAVEMYGLAEMLKRAGVESDSNPLPVIHNGQIIGTLPANFDPMRVKPTLLYEPRPGDFRLEGDKWIADRMLGYGDLQHAGVNLQAEYRQPW